MSETAAAQWGQLWQNLEALQDQATRLRHLSQREPLVQWRRGYPRAGTSRSHEGEVRDVLDGLQQRLGNVRALAPIILAQDPKPGLAADERAEAVGARLEALIRLTVGLKEQAFLPGPELPPHAPPYVVEPPGHDLAGTKAVLLALGIEEVVLAIRNAMLAVVNGA
ncbi:MAG TPA: hypothetical protein VKV57_04610 [bacterium]|nr:hypothetical protein [bacterium]